MKLICSKCNYGSDPNRPWVTKVERVPVSCPDCKNRTSRYKPIVVKDNCEAKDCVDSVSGTKKSIVGVDLE